MATDTEAQDISFEDALAEEKNEPSTDEPPRPRPTPTAPTLDTPESAPVPPQEFDQAETEDDSPQTDAENQKAAAEEEIEIIVPKYAAKEWKIGPEDNSLTYVQEQLSVICEIQWFSLLGEFLDKAMSGDSAISLNSLLSPPTPRNAGQLQLQDFQDADTFVHALGKLLVFSPDFAEKSICIWLSVPDYEWDLVRTYMKMSPSRGGLSHDMFEEILATFIDQNYGSIDRFFLDRFPRLRARFQARVREASRSRSSKR